MIAGKSFLRRRRGVTPVIATILLVAMTVVLVAILTVFVFNVVKMPNSNNSDRIYFGVSGPPTTSFPNQSGLWEWIPVIATSTSIPVGDLGFSIINSAGESILSAIPGIRIAVDAFNGSSQYGTNPTATGGSGHIGYFSISWWSPPPGQWYYYPPYGNPSTILPAGAYLGIHVFLKGGVIPPINILNGYDLIVYGIGAYTVSGSATLTG